MLWNYSDDHHMVGAVHAHGMATWLLPKHVNTNHTADDDWEASDTNVLTHTPHTLYISLRTAERVHIAPKND